MQRFLESSRIPLPRMGGMRDESKERLCRTWVLQIIN